ncbi:cytochrome c3 family protein [Pseudomonadota bacterium]
MMRFKAFTYALFSLLVSNVIAGEFEAPMNNGSTISKDNGETTLTIPKDKEVIVFETRIGGVTFPHKIHADLSITECKTCHHKHEPTDLKVKACHECHMHKKRTEAPKTKTAFHSRCTTCHEYTIAGGQTAGPMLKKCKLCHVK